MDIKSFLKNIDRNTIVISVVAIVILVAGGFVITKENSGFKMPALFSEASSKIAQDAVDYINNSQLSQTPASLVSFSEESGLVKVKIKIGEQEFDSYATKDGKLLFPQAFVMKEDDKKEPDGGSQQAGEDQPKEIVKADKAMLEAFIVSRCPFGLQMQRVIAKAFVEQPALADYVKIRYMGEIVNGKITAMHGDEEAKENLRQICIREEQPNKYWAYVSCDMKKGDSAGCEKSTGVDSAKLSACVTDPNKGLVYAKVDFDLSNKYGVTGSPTMILNGGEASEFDFGGRTANAIKGLVCAGSNNEPGFCSAQLNSDEAASSFSETYSSNSGSTGDLNC